MQNSYYPLLDLNPYIQTLIEKCTPNVISFVNAVCGTSHPLTTPITFIDTGFVDRVNYPACLAYLIIKIENQKYHFIVQAFDDAFTHTRIIQYNIHQTTQESEALKKLANFATPILIYVSDVQEVNPTRQHSYTFPEKDGAYEVPIYVLKLADYSIESLINSPLELLALFYPLANLKYEHLGYLVDESNKLKTTLWDAKWIESLKQVANTSTFVYNSLVERMSNLASETKSLPTECSSPPKSEIPELSSKELITLGMVKAFVLLNFKDKEIATRCQIKPSKVRKYKSLLDTLHFE